ncbi:hypothetical protein BKA69DRAFT_1044624 [Paraphysoderma sedebokerense]|nr:hypothetical protein BKA69DRAFT_1044624 [Paraphysoderma sedebokerense]
MTDNARKRKGTTKSESDRKKQKLGTVPIHRGKFKNKYLAKHTSLLRRADPANGLLITTEPSTETRALGQIRAFVEFFMNALFPDHKIVWPERPAPDDVDELPLSNTEGDHREEKGELNQNAKSTIQRGNEYDGSESLSEDGKSGKPLSVKAAQPNMEGQVDSSSVNATKDQLNSKVEVPSKSETKWLFADTGSAGLLFLRFRLDVSPVDFVTKVFHHIAQLPVEEQKHHLRDISFVHRIIPIQSTSQATTIKDIEQDCKSFFQTELSNCRNDPETKFAIVPESRNNPAISKSKIIQSIGPVIPQGCVSLSSPQYVLFVSVFKSVCAYSLLPNYYQYKKFNLRNYLGLDV